MHRLRYAPLLLLLLLLPATYALAQDAFVSVREGRFYRYGQPYTYLGTNFWYGINLASQGPGGDRARLRRELDRLESLGIRNLRIVAGSEGPDTEPYRMVPALQPAQGRYNEDLLDGLDFLLWEMGKRDMTAVVCLNNFWHWSGGMTQYLAWQNGQSIPYPPPAEGGNWTRYQFYASSFYEQEAATQAFEAHIARIVGRVNAYTGIAYREDPTIMAWQLANEPRGIMRGRAYRRWIDRTAAYIKSLDPRHLVSTGSEGNTSSPAAGNHFRKDHRSKHIDYTTIHIWVQNWNWYDPSDPASLAAAQDKALAYLDTHLATARALGKPLVLEEFGISRDGNDHAPRATVAIRDQYYGFIFQAILDRLDAGAAGVNFWAWGGEGRPRLPEAMWKPGDTWTGDPPHEPQGWYSVYDADATTLALIRDYAARLQRK
ncbi:MAG: mannanase [Bacteroidia bacterium]